MEMSLNIALQTAVNLEKMGTELYTDLLERFKDDPELKKMFTILLTDEAEHEKLFMELYQKHSDNQIVMTEEQKNFLEITDLSRYFGKMKEIDNDAEILDVLRLVYYIERDAVLFFSGIRDVVGSNDDLDEIIRQEKIHMTNVLNCIIENKEFKGLDII
jgi:rubrerythrin